MELILEIIPSGSAQLRRRVRLDAFPTTIGRGLANDIVLDDPYVDGDHARIERDDDGTLTLVDCGSVNGLMRDGASPENRFTLQAGDRIRIGRTLLHFRDPEEPVPAALPNSQNQSLASRLLSTPRGQVGIALASIALLALSSWLGSYRRNSGSDVFEDVLIVALLGALWAGIWSIAGRMTVHRFHYLGHFAIFSIAMVGLDALWSVSEWMTFLYPGSWLTDHFALTASLFLLVLLVAAHMKFASHEPWKFRLRAGVVSAIIVGAIILIGEMVVDDHFSTRADFPGVLKPVPVAWLPTRTVAEFSLAADRLRLEVDALVTEEPEPAATSEQEAQAQADAE